MILAIDLGSTSFKAAIFDRRLRQAASGSHRLPHRFGSGGHVEIDVATVQAALRGALAAAGVDRHEISIIALTSQAQTFTLVDERGQARQPFISWQDSRAVKACADLKKALPDFARHCSFADLLPALQVSLLRHVRPGRRMMALKLPSYVLRLWTGASVTDNNIAAMSGLYSLPLKGWWPEAMRACGVGERQLPAIVPVGEVAAVTTPAARRYGLPVGVPVVLAGNDQTAGGYAAGLEKRQSLLITLGTAQVAYACCGRMPQSRTGTIRGPYPDGLFYRMAADGCGGSVVNWAKTVLKDCGDDESYFREAGRAPRGSNGLVFDAALDTGRGRWTNLGLHHTTADLARSIIESLSQRMAAMVRGLGVQVKGRTVLAAGGGSNRPLWCQAVAEVLGARLMATEAGPLAGAARMAARHLK
jgi:xylulokinase